MMFTSVEERVMLQHEECFNQPRDVLAGQGPGRCII